MRENEGKQQQQKQKPASLNTNQDLAKALIFIYRGSN